MANKEFDFDFCPWCGAEYKDSPILKVQPDQVSIGHVFLECDSCGMVYRVNRKVVWEAERIATEKPLSQEVGDFLGDWQERIMKTRQKASNH